jgi:N-acetylmuramoyl-L-alanine amidase
MYTKNKAATFFAILIIVLIVFIVYFGSSKPVSVVIQAGHEGRTSGNTGAESKLYREEQWNIIVADEVAKKLRSWHIDVKRVPAKVRFIKAKIAVSIHFDGAKIPCNSGASIGYPNKNSYAFARRWEALYKTYFPYGWHEDNFTANLTNYYAYRWIHADKFLILELGEITCRKQTKWLKPRLKKIAHLIAYAIARELGEDINKPDFLLP